MTQHDRLDRFLNEASAIVLAAGRGTRMGGGSKPKVCRRVAGVPCVRRLVDALRIAGIRTRIVVVPPRHGPVRGALDPLPSDTRFAVQPSPRGTGDAARCGAALLPATARRRPVLVLAGDKIIEPETIRKMARAFLSGRADLVIATGRAADFPDAGMLVRDADGRPRRIVEVADIRYHRFLAALADRVDEGLAPGPDAIDRLARPFEPLEKKRVLWRERVAGLLASTPAGGASVAVALRSVAKRAGARAILAEPGTASGEANLSVYLLRAGRLQDALGAVTPRNVQGEFYLTDIVEILAGDGARIVTAPVDRADEIMAFNTPEELAAVRREVQRRQRDAAIEAGKICDTARDGSLVRVRADAGSRRPVQAADDARRFFAAAFGGAPPRFAIRAPGRVNLMGRHIDHQGGVVHPIAIDRGIMAAVRPRNDDRIRLRHADEDRYASVDLRIAHALERLGSGGWAEAVNGPDLPPRAPDPRQAWSRYAEAAAARLQTAHPERRLRGFDGLIAADLPEGYGLASSSALTVACLMAISIANGLDRDRRDAAVLAGEAEWYVGTRGGFADHAGILLAAAGSVRGMFEDGAPAGDPAPFPAEAALFLALSRQPAEKGAAARHAYNARIAAYLMACAWLAADGAPASRRHPGRLGDFWTGEDGPAVGDLLERLARMPELAPAAAFGQVAARAPRLEARLRQIWERQDDPRYAYPLRGTALFGFAEMARARRFVPALLRTRWKEAGAMMLRSHDGDRVSRPRAGRRAAWTSDCRTETLLRLARRCRTSLDPLRLLADQPGAYGCSTPEIDAIVDAAAAVPGVFGAQISGAGLGGAVMICARPDTADAVRHAATAAGAAGFLRIRSAAAAEAVEIFPASGR